MYRVDIALISTNSADSRNTELINKIVLILLVKTKAPIIYFKVCVISLHMAIHTIAMAMLIA